MMEEAEEEEEEDEDEDYEDYIEETDLAYEDEDGTTYLGMSMLPAVSATVKKTEKSSGIARLFKKSRSVETEAVVMAGTAALSEVAGITVTSAYKQIEELDNGNYRLHLGLAGGGDKKGFDIVLVVDESSSMDKSIGGYHGDSKMDILKEALYGTGNGWNGSGGFIRNIKQNYPQSRFSIVTYGSDYDVDLSWTTEQQTVLNKVNNLKAHSSDTNYESGLWGAIQVLKQRTESDNIPVVVFLTDGLPTAYRYQRDQFDYGYNIYWGENSYANYNLTVLDCAKVVIGDDVLIGPNVNIFTAAHPISPSQRKSGLEFAKDIEIGDGSWIGGATTINPGVKIGKNVVIKKAMIAEGAVIEDNAIIKDEDNEISVVSEFELVKA